MIYKTDYMNNYEKNLYALVKQCHNLHGIGKESYYPKIVSINTLRCRVNGLGIVPVKKTPHYRYFHGKSILEGLFKNKRNDLELYFMWANEKDFETKMQSAVSLNNDKSTYLGGVNNGTYILVDEDNCILDGNLRAAKLLSLGATHVVVMESRKDEFNYANTSLEFDKNASTVNLEVENYLANAKGYFKEWYSPLELGPYKLPKIAYPNFQEVWDFDESEGIRNWLSSIMNVVPDVAGKKVLDVGSNIGLYSLELSRMGADVCGVDRGPRVVQANNHLLGAQSVPNQAYSIRNIYEVFYGKRFPRVAFAEIDLMEFDFSDTKCDLFFSCRVLYHLGKKRMSEVIYEVSKNIPEIVLQANEGHGSGKLGKIASMDFHKQLLIKCGYKIRREYAPEGSVHPTVYATK
jgi:SAM-dependent methyltransferase